MNKWGMHTPNEGFRNLEAFFTLGVDNFTALEISCDRTYEESADKHSIGRELRNRCPDARILVRFYGWTQAGGIVLDNWDEVDPINWARQCADWANSHRWLTDHFTLANEMNLPAEGGGWTKEWYGAINDWLVWAITEFRRLCPWAIIHWPALASGHHEDDDPSMAEWEGFVGYEICAPSIRLCDVVDHHDYWHIQPQLYLPEFAQWYALRFTKARKVLLELGIDKPMFISECGWYGQHEDPRGYAGAALCDYFRMLYDYPYILGATAFIWDSDDAHPGQRIGRCSETWWPIQSADKEEVSMNSIMSIIDLLPKHATKRWSPRSASTIDTWVVHHNGKGSDMLAPKVVANYHVDDMGWPGIAYHHYILGDGTIYRTNYETTLTGHTSDAETNARSCSIVLAGCHTDTWPTTKQLCSLEEVIALHPSWKVVAHSEVSQTVCPGKWFFNWEEDEDDETIWAQLGLLTERVEAIEGIFDKIKAALT